MKTYTGSRNLFGQLTNNPDPANLALGDILINESSRFIINSASWPFLEKTKVDTTVLGQQYYSLPSDFDKSIGVTLLNGSTLYTLQEVTSRGQWDILNTSTNISSTIPSHFYIFDGDYGIFPKPSVSGLPLTIIYQRTNKDLSIGDYTTGTVNTATNGSTAISGSSTAWTSKMNGMWLTISDSLSANTGDGFWYQIDSVSDANHLTLTTKYNGQSISSGSASYIIGQTSIIPEEFQILPIYRAAQIYYTSIQPETARAQLYEKLYNDGMKKMFDDLGSKSSSPVLSVK
jgi:hypothetical protein